MWRRVDKLGSAHASILRRNERIGDLLAAIQRADLHEQRAARNHKAEGPGRLIPLIVCQDKSQHDQRAYVYRRRS